uniref:Integrase core domain containing protein n=1 Tax=Solanum tuberosum TaxID=4113 RepID=M1DBP5_SOLTU
MQELSADSSSRAASQAVVSFTGNFTARQSQHQPKGATGTMYPRRKNTAPQSSPTASQSGGDHTQKSSSSEVQINIAPEDHPPRATRSRRAKVILQDTPPSLKREVVVPVAVRNRDANLMLVREASRVWEAMHSLTAALRIMQPHHYMR